MKWYNFETIDRGVKEELAVYLKTQSVYYEVSSAGNGWHFEINTDAGGATKIIGELLKMGL